ncbi:NADH-quinone oxidoreductase subunit K [Buchnera aphidicola (Cinara splendens)]|uniref:NADH-quinone oxidoreductase subunit K n=1 Tax=Buchnera aphidicola (Cinara splendens) TaxID=2518979 RepID=A0A451DE54_9GAMM|nr:NADH-quinone oxidoreductase subunit NuoK [Buchnera aphidicola]VFP84876.1 NADH-quinone oxidoreductase subunit K [Buchnera aphidicola (Cinara splendens)]
MFLLHHGIIVSILIFVLGIISLLKNKNLIFILIGLELLTNSTSLAIMLAGHYWNQIDGQIMYIFIITAAAAEVSIILACYLTIYKKYNTLDILKLSEINK